MPIPFSASRSTYRPPANRAPVPIRAGPGIPRTRTTRGVPLCRGLSCRKRQAPCMKLRISLVSTRSELRTRRSSVPHTRHEVASGQPAPNVPGRAATDTRTLRSLWASGSDVCGDHRRRLFDRIIARCLGRDVNPEHPILVSWVANCRVEVNGLSKPLRSRSSSRRGVRSRSTCRRTSHKPRMAPSAVRARGVPLGSRTRVLQRVKETG